MKAIVLGEGLIPRTTWLAPQKAPFNITYAQAQQITESETLQLYLLAPSDGHTVRVTSANLKKMWNAFVNPPKKVESKLVEKKAVDKKIPVPSAKDELSNAVQKAFDNTMNSTKGNMHVKVSDVSSDTKKEDQKDESIVIKPIMNNK